MPHQLATLRRPSHYLLPNVHSLFSEGTKPEKKREINLLFYPRREWKTRVRENRLGLISQASVLGTLSCKSGRKGSFASPNSSELNGSQGSQLERHVADTRELLTLNPAKGLCVNTNVALPKGHLAESIAARSYAIHHQWRVELRENFWKIAQINFHLRRESIDERTNYTRITTPGVDVQFIRRFFLFFFEGNDSTYLRAISCDTFRLADANARTAESVR